MEHSPPLLDAAPAIPLHAFAAMAAFVRRGAAGGAERNVCRIEPLGWIWVVC